MTGRARALIGLAIALAIVYFVLPAFTNYLWFREYSEVRIALPNVAPDDIVVGLFTALLGILCVLVGYVTPLGSWISSSIPKPRYEWSHETALAEPSTDRPELLQRAARDWAWLRQLAGDGEVTVTDWERALIHILSAATEIARMFA